MTRVGMGPCRAIALLIATFLLRGTQGSAEEAAGGRDVNLEVAVLSATGRAEKPAFDPKVPREIKRQLEAMNLPYGRYDVVGAIQRKDAAFGAEAEFGLPEKESLVIKPSAHNTRPGLLHIGYRMLDSKKKAMLVSTMTVSYEKTFFIQRLKGADAVIMGVCAHKPGKP